MAKIYPAKSQEQLKFKWQSMLKVPLSKVPWSPQEDAFLIKIVQEKGIDRWRDVAIELNLKSGSNLFRQGKQCRDRWTNHLDPNLKKGSWTDDEDVLLLNEFLQKGKKWSEIAKKLPGRTENSVKNRWISLLRKYKSDLTLEAIKEAEQFENNEDAWNNHIVKLLIESKEKLITPTNSGVASQEPKREIVKKSSSEPLESNLSGQELSRSTRTINSKNLYNKSTITEKVNVTPQVSGSESNKGFPSHNSNQEKNAERSKNCEGNKVSQQNLQMPPSFNPASSAEKNPKLALPNSQNAYEPQLNQNNFPQMPIQVTQQMYNGSAPPITNGTQAFGPNMYQNVTGPQPYPGYSMPQMPQMPQAAGYQPMQYNPYNTYPPANPWNNNFYPQYQPNPYHNPVMQMWHPNPNYSMNQPPSYPLSTQQMGMATQCQPLPMMMMPNSSNQVNHQFCEVQQPNFSENKSAMNPQNPNVYFAMVDMGKKEIFFMDHANQNSYNKALDSLKSNDQLDNSGNTENNQFKNVSQDPLQFDAPVDDDDDVNKLFGNFL